MMKIQATTTQDDYRKFSKISFKRVTDQNHISKKNFFATILIWAFFGFGASSIYYFYTYYAGLNFLKLNIGLIALALFLLGIIIVRWWQYNVYLKTVSSEDGTILGDMTFELNESGIIESGKNHKSEYPWHSIKIIKRDKENLYLFTDLVKAVILPISGLDKAELNELGDILKNKCNYDLSLHFSA